MHEGGCLCGRIRYRVTGEANNTTNCHCTQCRRASGAACLALSEFPTQAVEFLTEPPQYYRSSDIAERGFCSACGTTLVFSFLGTDTIDIATATLDDPTSFAPQDHLWVDSKIAWVNIDDGLPRYPKERSSR